MIKENAKQFAKEIMNYIIQEMVNANVKMVLKKIIKIRINANRFVMVIMKNLNKVDANARMVLLGMKIMGNANLEFLIA